MSLALQQDQSIQAYSCKLFLKLGCSGPVKEADVHMLASNKGQSFFQWPAKVAPFTSEEKSFCSSICSFTRFVMIAETRLRCTSMEFRRFKKNPMSYVLLLKACNWFSCRIELKRDILPIIYEAWNPETSPLVVIEASLSGRWEVLKNWMSIICLVHFAVLEGKTGLRPTKLLAMIAAGFIPSRWWLRGCSSYIGLLLWCSLRQWLGFLYPTLPSVYAADKTWVRYLWYQ